jgi:hypothetical protein
MTSGLKVRGINIPLIKLRFIKNDKVPQPFLKK